MSANDLWDTRPCLRCGTEVEVRETKKGTGHMHCPNCRDRSFFNCTRAEYLEEMTETADAPAPVPDADDAHELDDAHDGPVVDGWGLDDF